jgi:thymidylate synthase (FAD)
MPEPQTIKVLDHGFVRYVDHLGSDARVLDAARVSYRSESKGEEADKKLLHYLWKNKHTSPFEMLRVTLHLKMPIFVQRQYIRHRMQSVNEVSARYTQLPKEFYIPNTWRLQDPKNKQGSIKSAEQWDPEIGEIDLKLWGSSITFRSSTRALESICDMAYQVYERMLEQGIAREMARMILPLNIYTEFYATWDMKNLLHFITLRDDAHAQAEIQEYGRAIKAICRELFPWTMEAYDFFKFPAVDTRDPHNDQYRTP